MDNSLFAPFLGIASLIIMFISVVGYKGRVNKWSGILTVGRSWLISMGIVSAILMLCRIIFVLMGEYVDLVSGFLPPLVFVIIGMIQIRKAFLLCHTGRQKISCIAASVLIAYGFAVKVVLCLFTRTSVSTLYADNDEQGNAFPETIIDGNNNEYRLLHTTTSSSAVYQEIHGSNKQITVDINQLQGNMLMY